VKRCVEGAEVQLVNEVVESVLERAGQELFLKVYDEQQALGGVESFVTDHNGYSIVAIFGLYTYSTVSTVYMLRRQ
jgi:hypothetical protein